MKRSNKFIGLALCIIIVVGLSLTVTGRRGSNTNDKSVQPHPHLSESTATGSVRTNVEATARPEIAAAYGRLPLSFEENRGQTDSRVKFLSRGHGCELFLTSTEAILTLRQSRAKPLPGGTFGRSRAARRLKLARAKQNFAMHHPTAVRVSLVGANSAARVTGLDELPGLDASSP